MNARQLADFVADAVERKAPFLSKPFTPEGLARKVREVLNRPGHPDGNHE